MDGIDEIPIFEVLLRFRIQSCIQINKYVTRMEYIEVIKNQSVHIVSVCFGSKVLSLV